MIRLCVSRDQLHACDATYNRYEFVFQGDPRNKAKRIYGSDYNCIGCACGMDCHSGSRHKCTAASRTDQKAGGIWIRKETP